MTNRPPAERNERALPLGLGLVVSLLMVVLALVGVKPSVTPALSPTIDVFGILIGFLAGVRALIREDSPAFVHAQQSDLAERLDAAFRLALRLGFIGLTLSLLRLLVGDLPPDPICRIADAIWLGSVTAGGIACYLALRTTFILLAGKSRR